MKLTAQDRRVLRALELVGDHTPAMPGWVADAAQIGTYSSRETASRHLIKLTKLGLAERVGPRMFPSWLITPAGRSLLESMSKEG